MRQLARAVMSAERAGFPAILQGFSPRPGMTRVLAGSRSSQTRSRFRVSVAARSKWPGHVDVRREAGHGRRSGHRGPRRTRPGWGCGPSLGGACARPTVRTVNQGLSSQQASFRSLSPVRFAAFDADAEGIDGTKLMVSRETWRTFLLALRG
jgi:hypothetical protein